MSGFRNINVAELEAKLQRGGIAARMQAGLPVSA
jgi:hypothetical protein